MQEYILDLLQIQNQLKIFHWQTKSYARHNAYGQTYDDMSDLIDTFVEVCIGKHGRFSVNQSALELVDLNDETLKTFLNAVTNFLISLSGKLDPKNDTDLLNIRDEMLAKVNKLKYLLTLN